MSTTPALFEHHRDPACLVTGAVLLQVGIEGLGDAAAVQDCSAMMLPDEGSRDGDVRPRRCAVGSPEWGGLEFVIERARLGRVTSYTELNAALLQRVGLPGFDFQRADKRGAGRHLREPGRVLPRRLTS
jgi:hypothetical protein